MDSNLEQYPVFSLQALYSYQSDLIMTYGFSFLLFLISLYFLFPKIKLKLAEYKNSRILKKLGKYQLKNVAIKISLDETIYIDNLILIPKGIFVLNIMKYSGIIFAGENVEQWTQLLNKKSYKFPNPLRDLEVCESALRSVVEDCNVVGYIAFESNCKFPKGKPDKISLLHEMQNELEFLKGDISLDLKEKWNALQHSDICEINIKQTDLDILVRGEQKSIKNIIGILFLASSLLLFAYQISGYFGFENLGFDNLFTI